MQSKEVIPYGQHAKYAENLKGWYCDKCKKYWGNVADSQHMASYCCCTSRECKACGKPTSEKYYTACDSCREEDRLAAWGKKYLVEWDGSWPICDDDEFFWDTDQLADYCDGLDELDAIHLQPCRPTEPREFHMSEHLQDCLGEDQEIDEEEINATVNKWIDAHMPFAYKPVPNQRLDTAAVLAKLGIVMVRLEGE